MEAAENKEKRMQEAFEIIKKKMSLDIETKEIQMDLFYPNVDSSPKYLALGLCDVRASDGIRIHYDFDRDGWVIEQIKHTEGLMHEGTWQEMGYFESWALKQEA